MVDYNQLEAKSEEVAGLVVQLIRTMTPDRTEKYTVQNFITGVNTVGGYIKSMGYDRTEEEVKRRAKAAIDEVGEVIFSLEMLNHMAVVDIACYESVYSAYNELIDLLVEAAR